MAEVTIRLQTNPATGKKDIIVSLRRDEDLLPHEHEQMHRALVEKLLDGGIVKATEMGQIVVERESESREDQTPASQQEEHTAESEEA
ncbi:MAG TPA: hypothetical protein VHB77_19150 [Planctomycetaceae bacterium]|nr:hypothetical protein [Planctomycetaceae bacterium]